MELLLAPLWNITFTLSFHKCSARATMNFLFTLFSFCLSQHLLALTWTLHFFSTVKLAEESSDLKFRFTLSATWCSLMCEFCGEGFMWPYETLGSVLGWRGEKGISVFVRSSSWCSLTRERYTVMNVSSGERGTGNNHCFWKIFVENMSMCYPCTRGTGSSDVNFLESLK